MPSQSRRSTRRASTRRASTRRAASRRTGGASCNGVVSIMNASKRSNCSWERTANGKAKLGPKVRAQSNNNLLLARGGRKTRRAGRR